MDIDKIFENQLDDVEENIFGIVNTSINEARELQKKKVAENVHIVINALKKIEQNIRNKYDVVGSQLEKRILSIKDGRNGIDGRDGKDGKDGKNGKDGKPGKDGINGKDGVDGQDGVSVINANIDFDGSLVISLSNGREINVGEVMPLELAERIKVITNGGGTSQSVLDTLASLQAQITALSTSITTATLNVTGNTTLGDASTDTVRVNGYMGVGASANAPMGLFVRPTALTGVTQYGASFQPNATSGATSAVIGVDLFPIIPDAAITVSEVNGLEARQGSKGASATVTTWTGLKIRDIANGATNYGVWSLVSSGSNKWNIYASGTAANYFAGNVQFAAGTAAAPALTRFGDDNTGIFFPAADTIAFSEGGVEAMRLDSSGNLGIGTTSAGDKVSVGGAIRVTQDGSSVGVYLAGGLRHTGSSNFYIDSNTGGAAGNIIFRNGSGFSEQMRLSSSGNLGIAVTPSAWGSEHAVLQLGFSGAIQSYKAGTTSEFLNVLSNAYNDNTNWLYIRDGAATRYLLTEGDHRFFSAPVGTTGGTITFTELMRLTASGSLGVGTTSPNGIIHAEVASGNAVIRSKTGGSGSAILILETTGIGAQQINANTGSVQNLTMTVAGSERLRIDASGNLGIGTTSPVNKLQVVGSFGRGAPVTKTGDFTLAATENWIICNGTGTITVTLPAASSWTGREFTIKTIAAFTVISNASNVVPLAGGAAGTAILAATAGTWATLVSDGTNWIIMQA